MIRCFYPKMLAGDPPFSLPERTYELAQFLTRVLEVETIGHGLRGRRVAYHHGCHALRELGVEREPVRLLEACGATVVDWEDDRECCGFGGLFSAKLPEVSAAMADRKLESLPVVDLVTSADGGCLLQLQGRAARTSETPRFRHLASVLWEGARS